MVMGFVIQKMPNLRLISYAMFLRYRFDGEAESVAAEVAPIGVIRAPLGTTVGVTCSDPPRPVP